MKPLTLFVVSLFATTAAFAQPPGQPPAQVVVDEVVETELTQTVSATAQVVSPQATTAVAEVAGRVVFSAQLGEFVPAGQLVYQVDTQALELQHTEQQAVTQRNRLQMAYYKKELGRLKQLANTANVSVTALDEAVHRVALAEQDLSIAAARLGLIADQISRAKYVAPTDLVISQRMVKSGEFVNRGQPVVAAHNPQSLELVFELPLNWRQRVRLGDRYDVATSAGHNVSVVVSHAVAAANALSQTFQVRAQLTEQAHTLVALNEVVTISAQLPLADRQVAIPRDAIVLRQGGTFVYQIDETEGVAKQVAVELGKGSKDYVSFKGELQPGAKVAVRGAERLRDGQKVIVKT